MDENNVEKVVLVVFPPPQTLKGCRKYLKFQVFHLSKAIKT